MVYPVTPPPPTPRFKEGMRLQKFQICDVDKSITEGIRRQNGQLDRGDQGPGDRRDSAGQTDQPEISQAEHETQINLSSEETRGGPLWTWMEKLKCRERGRGGQITSPSPAWKIPENQPSQPYPNLQVQCQPITQRTR